MSLAAAVLVDLINVMFISYHLHHLRGIIMR